jgi:glycosyltransferase involved in cell wall biosynthesis
VRILFIAPLPPPVNGHSLAAEMLYRELVKEHEVELVDLKKESLKEGVDSMKRIVEILSVLKEISRKKKDVDAIYLTISESLAGNLKDLFIYAICFDSLDKMRIHLHGGSIGKLLFDRHGMLRQINKFFLKRLAGVIVLGRSHLEIFKNLIDEDRMHIVPNAVQDYLFSTATEIRTKFVPDGPLRIIFIGNMIGDKGYDEIVDAYSNLDDGRRRMLKIDFAGRFESEAKKISFLTKIRGLSGIRYRGVVDGNEKKELFSQAHVFCLPSSFLEGQPIAILEAYASGCVVLATGQPGIRDIFSDGVNGFEIEGRSAVSVKAALERALNQSREKLFEIALANRHLAGKKYAASIYAASLKKLLT